jgi:hypothetical protein
VFGAIFDLFAPKYVTFSKQSFQFVSNVWKRKKLRHVCTNFCDNPSINKENMAKNVKILPIDNKTVAIATFLFTNI